MPQPHGMISARSTATNRMPPGSGIPSRMPIGTMSTTANAMRSGSGHGMPMLMSEASPTAAMTEAIITAVKARTVTERMRCGWMRRLIRLPIPVPRSNENNVTVREYTG